MAGTYKTKSGDTWHGIANEVYGDDVYTSFLMSNNQKMLNYFIFPEGISLVIEDLPEEESLLPEWRS